MNLAALSIHGFGHFGKSLLWASSVLVFAFYLTEVAGLAPTTMGGVMALSLTVNAVSDRLIGQFAGQRVTTIAAAARLQLAGALIAAVCFVGFAQTALVPPGWRAEYALASLVMFRLGYSLYDVPQNAVLGLMVGTDRDRSQLSATRYAAAGLANIVVTLCLSLWVVGIGRDDRAAGFMLFANAFAAVAMISAALVALYFTRAGSRADHRPAQVSSEAAPRPSERLPALLAFGSIVVFSSLMSVFSKLKIYFAAFAFPSDTNAVAFLLAVALGQVLTQPLWAWGGQRLTLVRLYVLAAASVMGGGILFGLVAQGAATPLLVAAFVFGATSSGLLMAIWAIMGNVAGADRAAAMPLFGQFTFASKLAQALSIAVVGQVLDMAEYRDGMVGLVIIAMTASVVLTGVLCLAIALVIGPRPARQ